MNNMEYSEISNDFQLGDFSNYDDDGKLEDLSSVTQVYVESDATDHDNYPRKTTNDGVEVTDDDVGVTVSIPDQDTGPDSCSTDGSAPQMSNEGLVNFLPVNN